MGSETEQKIPIVDLTKENLKPGTDEWFLACKEIRQAFEEYGCFEAVYDKIPPELHNSVFAVTEDLFDLPLETKMQRTSDRPYHSYMGQFAVVPLYESVAIDHPTTLEGSQQFTNLMWPTGNDIFRENAQSMAKLLSELYEMATRMVFDSYGVERLHDSNMELTSYLLRFFKYRPRQANETNMGLQCHIDRTFMSLVHQHQVEGLQVKSKDGQWINVKPSPTSFLVIAGHIVGAWSNDRVRPCEHQVIMKEDKTRYSIRLFAFINGVIEVPGDLVDENHPLRYKPIDHFGWLRFQEQRRAPYTIKAYCGI